MKCAALLKCDDLQAAKVANLIWYIMNPFRNSTPLHSDNQSNRLCPWKEICDEAVKFAVLVRSSKDQYICEAPIYGNEVLETETSVQDQEIKASGIAGDNAIVSFTLFGALAKYPEHSNARLVLEKAYVVSCQPQQPQQHLLDREDTEGEL